MNPVKLSYLKALREILLDTINVPSESLYLVGGCVRDAACGVEPKDIDVIVLDHFDWCDESAFSRAEMIARDFREMGAKTAIYQAYGMACGADSHDANGKTLDFDENIWCGIHIQYATDPVGYDVLLSRHSDIDDVMDSFDCNWNQQYIGEKVHHYWRGWNPLHFTGKPLREGRREYITAKYNEVFKCQ